MKTVLGGAWPICPKCGQAMARSLVRQEDWGRPIDPLAPTTVECLNGSCELGGVRFKMQPIEVFLVPEKL